MNDLEWLAGHRFKEAMRYEYTWDFVFDDDATVTTECLWRPLDNGRIRLTSQDDGQHFGLTKAIDASLQVNQVLVGSSATSVFLREGTLDLEIRFDTGHALQVIPESAGFEAWNVRSTSRQYMAIAVGGGEQTVFSQGSGD